MAISATVETFDRDIELMLEEDLSPEAQSAALAAFARESLAEAQQSSRAALGRVPPHETTVDGRIGAPVETVRPDGTVFYEFDLLEELFVWIAAQLVLHSPVLTGAYSRSHLFLADGVEVPVGQPAPGAAEYVFLSDLPYARKIEAGQSDQAPDGVYEAVAVLAARRFGNLARIRFSYRTLSPSQAATARDRNAENRAERQPAIVITLGR